MPAAISEEIHEKAKVIAIQVGYREAGRQLGISENTILSWAHREGWAGQVQAARDAIVRKNESQGMQSAAIKTVSEVQMTLGERSKLRAAKVGDSILRNISKIKGPAQIAASQPFAQTVGALAKVHGWGSEATQAAPLIAIQLNGYVPPEV